MYNFYRTSLCEAIDTTSIRPFNTIRCRFKTTEHIVKFFDRLLALSHISLLGYSDLKITEPRRFRQASLTISNHYLSIYLSI